VASWDDTTVENKENKNNRDLLDRGSSEKYRTKSESDTRQAEAESE
jgi:hypothetical protein